MKTLEEIETRKGRLEDAAIDLFARWRVGVASTGEMMSVFTSIRQAEIDLAAAEDREAAL